MSLWSVGSCYLELSCRCNPLAIPYHALPWPRDGSSRTCSLSAGLLPYLFQLEGLYTVQIFLIDGFLRPLFLAGPSYLTMEAKPVHGKTKPAGKQNNQEITVNSY